MRRFLSIRLTLRLTFSHNGYPIAMSIVTLLVIVVLVILLVGLVR